MLGNLGRHRRQVVTPSVSAVTRGISEPELPQGWARVALQELGRWIGGGTPSKLNADFWTGGNIPWVSPKDMKSNRIRDAQDHITMEAVAKSATSVVDSGSVLVVTRSGILRRTLPVAIADVPVSLNQDLKALTPHVGIAPEYVLHALAFCGDDILRACSKSGTTVQSVETPSLLRWEIPIPPEREQHRIVSAIETQLTRLDSAVASLNRVQANLKRYRASVLKAAVEGRLVPTEAELARREGREYEPASVLLGRILKERRRCQEVGGSAGRDRSDLFELPEGWRWTTVAQLAQVTGGLTKNPERDRLEHQMPYLRVANVYADELRVEDMLSIGVRDTELNRVLLEPGDLLVVEGNGSPDQIGRVAVWDGRISPCIHQNHVIKARFEPVEIARWVLCWLLSPTGRQVVARASSSTSGLYTLSLTKVGDLPVPLCPLAEQVRVLGEVERLNSVALAAEQTTRIALARGNRLRQSVLKWAFEGKLVDQDPNDEPASVLLERIKVEREATGTELRKPRQSRRKSRKA